MSRLIDFDAFRAEQKSEPLELKLGGVIYQLPPSMPATLALDIIRLQKEHGDDMEFDPAEMTNMGAALLGGEEQFRAMLNAGHVTLDELPDLIKLVVEMYGVTENPGNREARRARAPRSR